MVDRTAPLPQLSGRVFLTDAGLETDVIFNHGVEIREFAAHTLLPIPADREKMPHTSAAISGSRTSWALATSSMRRPGRSTRTARPTSARTKPLSA